METIGIAGAGAWGTALANAAAIAGNDVVLWMRSPEQAAALAATRSNARFLPGVALHERIQPTADLADLDSAHVLAMIDAQRRSGQRRRKLFRQRRIAAGERHRGGQAARHIVGEAGAGEHGDGRAGAHLFHHVAEESSSAALNAFRAEYQRRRGGQGGGKGRRHVPRRLRRCDEKNRTGRGEIGKVGGRLDSLMQRNARQEARVAACRRERRRLFGRSHPQHDIVAGDRRSIGQSRSPGSRSGDADGLGLFAHLRDSSVEALARSACRASMRPEKPPPKKPRIAPLKVMRIK